VTLRTLRAVWLALAAALLLAACTTSRLSTTQPDSTVWSGRLVLRVAQPDKPTHFSANFELAGNARNGELILTTPLGITVATLTWTPRETLLRHDGQVRSYDSVEAMTLDATGAAFPLPALFAWLQGEAMRSDGWQADLSQLQTEGLIQARRSSPAPATELKLVLDRP
jgi:outer membrane lipoprotein LolB